ncbi:hypothetical protein BV455_03353 [Parageobacillus caldoxylosilyticus]|nr:hypothetical protein BV455_03353 [Parageobacillus caldoxylosilyticus]
MGKYNMIVGIAAAAGSMIDHPDTMVIFPLAVIGHVALRLMRTSKWQSQSRIHRVGFGFFRVKSGFAPCRRRAIWSS